MRAEQDAERFIRAHLSLAKRQFAFPQRPSTRNNPWLQFGVHTNSAQFHDLSIVTHMHSCQCDTSQKSAAGQDSHHPNAVDATAKLNSCLTNQASSYSLTSYENFFAQTLLGKVFLHDSETRCSAIFNASLTRCCEQWRVLVATLPPILRFLATANLRAHPLQALGQSRAIHGTASLDEPWLCDALVLRGTG